MESLHPLILVNTLKHEDNAIPSVVLVLTCNLTSLMQLIPVHATSNHQTSHTWQLLNGLVATFLTLGTKALFSISPTKHLCWHQLQWIMDQPTSSWHSIMNCLCDYLVWLPHSLGKQTSICNSPWHMWSQIFCTFYACLCSVFHFAVFLMMSPNGFQSQARPLLVLPMFTPTLLLNNFSLPFMVTTWPALPLLLI